MCESKWSAFWQKGGPSIKLLPYFGTSGTIICQTSNCLQTSKQKSFSHFFFFWCNLNASSLDHTVPSLLLLIFLQHSHQSLAFFFSLLLYSSLLLHCCFCYFSNARVCIIIRFLGLSLNFSSHLHLLVFVVTQPRHTGCYRSKVRKVHAKKSYLVFATCRKKPR